MNKRSDYGRRFGPMKDEATYLVMLRLINELRETQGLPEITEDEFLDTVLNDVAHLPPYDWMFEE